MCSHYQYLKELDRLKRLRLTIPLNWEPPRASHAYKKYLAPVLRRPPELSSGDEAVPAIEILNAQFGLLPYRAADPDEFYKKYDTLNARSETAAKSYSYSRPWDRQHCLIPAEWFNEPDWTSGKSVDTKISRVDGEPVMIAGLWDTWRSKITQELTHSFTMLTVNADDHPLMKRFHRPGKEKRMLVVLQEDEWEPWLDATGAETQRFMRQLPAELLKAEPAAPKPAQAELI